MRSLVAGIEIEMGFVETIDFAMKREEGAYVSSENLCWRQVRRMRCKGPGQGSVRHHCGRICCRCHRRSS